MVGRGWTQPGGRPHAEVEALRRAGEARARRDALRRRWSRARITARRRPAPTPSSAAGVARVVVGAGGSQPRRSPGRAMRGCAQQGVAVDVGLGRRGGAPRPCRPHPPRRATAARMCTLKLAVSADGKAGLAGRKPVAITGEAARARVHLMRAHERRHADRHRHRAGGRSAAHLPPAGHAGARRCGSCSTAHCALPTRRQWSPPGTRNADLGVRRGQGRGRRLRQR